MSTPPGLARRGAPASGGLSVLACSPICHACPRPSGCCCIIRAVLRCAVLCCAVLRPMVTVQGQKIKWSRACDLSPDPLAIRVLEGHIVRVHPRPKRYPACQSTDW